MLTHHNALVAGIRNVSNRNCMMYQKKCKETCTMYNNYKHVERFNEITFYLQLGFLNIKITRTCVSAQPKSCVDLSSLTALMIHV